MDPKGATRKRGPSCAGHRPWGRAFRKAPPPPGGPASRPGDPLGGQGNGESIGWNRAADADGSWGFLPKEEVVLRFQKGVRWHFNAVAPHGRPSGPRTRYLAVEYRLPDGRRLVGLAVQ